MSSSEYISNIHMEILHLNKNFFTNEENTTLDNINLGNKAFHSRSNSHNSNSMIKLYQNQKSQFDKNKVKKNILKQEALNKSSDEINKNEVKLRFDARGNPIDKNKKQRVTFKDRISKKEPLVSIETIESYKEYNLLTNFNINENILKERSKCKCTCNII